ncbi:MAG: serine/threonine-protein kinase [Myxococcaceae bacterium]
MNAFLAGRSPPAELPLIAEHLDRCDRCRDKVLNAAKAFASTMGSRVSLRPHDAGQGDLVGRYVILARLGSGSFGTVYAAFDPELERKVALKVLSADTKGSAARELMGEAQALARLSHANVVPVYDVGEHQGHVFIAMELVKGTTLTEWLKTPRKPREVLKLFHELGAGLLAAHQAGLVHRDFKPDNLLVGDDGHGRVSDFGLARVVETPGNTREPSLVMAGTPAYMSPEQLENKPADARSDQFSFCVALHEALFGRRPFGGENIVELRESMQKRPQIPLKVGVALSIRQMMLRGLSENPADRNPSMNEVLGPLEDPNAWPRRVRLGLLAIAAALTVVWATLNVAKPPPPPPPCAGAERLLMGTWDPARASALTAALQQGTPPVSDGTLQQVTTALDRWAKAWVAERTAACEATRVRKEQSEQLLDRRVACLDRRVAEVRALLDVLQYAPTAEVEDRAVAAVEAITPVTVCSDKNALLDSPAPPENAGARSQVRDAIERLSRAKAVLDSAEPTQALPEATLALSAATDAGYAPLIAEARLQVALALEADGKHEDAARADAEAFKAANAARDDRTAARAAIHAYRETGRLEREQAKSEVWREVARSSVARLHDDPLLLGEYTFVEAGGAYERHDHAKAATGYHDACELYRRTLGPSVELGNCLVREGQAWLQAGDFAKAQERCKQGLEQLSSRLGKEHPTVALAKVRLALLEYNLGDLDQAVTLLEAGREGIQRAFPKGHPGRFEADYVAVYPMLDHGDVATARAAGEEARSLAKAEGLESKKTASDVLYAEVLRREGKLAEALALAEPAWQWRDQQNHGSSTLIADLTELGQILGRARADRQGAHRAGARRRAGPAVSPGAAVRWPGPAGLWAGAGEGAEGGPGEGQGPARRRGAGLHPTVTWRVQKPAAGRSDHGARFVLALRPSRLKNSGTD